MVTKSNKFVPTHSTGIIHFDNLANHLVTFFVNVILKRLFLPHYVLNVAIKPVFSSFRGSKQVFPLSSTKLVFAYQPICPYNLLTLRYGKRFTEESKRRLKMGPIRRHLLPRGIKVKVNNESAMDQTAIFYYNFIP